MTRIIKLALVFCLFSFAFSLHFDLSQENSRCYIDELFGNGVAVIKYKIWSTPHGMEKSSHWPSQMRIFVLDEQHRVQKIEQVTGMKGKFSFIGKEDGYYRVCIEKTNIYWREPEPIFVKIKITSDNMDEPNILDALRNKDLNPLASKVERIKKKGGKLIKNQENEIHREDSSAHRQMEYSHYYYYIAVIQILIVIVLAMHNAFAFKSYVNKYSLPIN